MCIRDSPTPGVQWQLNDKPLTSSGPISIRTDDAGLSTLEVDDSSRLTAGKYRVVAENNLGRATADIEVAVTGQSLAVCQRLITFRVTCSRGEMYIGTVCVSVCVCVCLSLAAFAHYCTDPDVTWEW